MKFNSCTNSIISNNTRTHTDSAIHSTPFSDELISKYTAQRANDPQQLWAAWEDMSFKRKRMHCDPERDSAAWLITQPLWQIRLNAESVAQPHRPTNDKTHNVLGSRLLKRQFYKVHHGSSHSSTYYSACLTGGFLTWMSQNIIFNV